MENGFVLSQPSSRSSRMSFALRSLRAKLDAWWHNTTDRLLLRWRAWRWRRQLRPGRRSTMPDAHLITPVTGIASLSGRWALWVRPASGGRAIRMGFAVGSHADAMAAAVLARAHIKDSSGPMEGVVWAEPLYDAPG
jgi:hypothetical protein